mmetsp:Transcript_23547/g.34869  ORF Transcript_23547/g.34869 Transcript_23547/m.34869 type:complete len:85 (-) Transcript_23547:97-351(-)
MNGSIKPTLGSITTAIFKMLHTSNYFVQVNLSARRGNDGTKLRRSQGFEVVGYCMRFDTERIVVDFVTTQYCNIESIKKFLFIL